MQLELHEARRTQTRRGRLRHLAGGSDAAAFACALGLAAIYVALGRPTFAFDAPHGGIPFAPEGIALVAFIIYGPRVWPGVFLGHLSLALTTDFTLSAAVIVAAVSAAEGAAGGYLFHRWQISPQLERSDDILRLVVLILIVLQPLRASGGIGSQVLLHDLSGPWRTWVCWWAAGSLGQLLVAASLLAWTSRGRRPDPAELRTGLTVVATYVVLTTAVVLIGLAGSVATVRLICFSGFLTTVTWIAIRSAVAATTLCALIAAGGLLVIADAGPDHLQLLAGPDGLLYANLVVLGGVTSALIVSSLIGQLRGRAEELRRTIVAQAKVFSVIGHDLRSPIADACMYLDIALAGGLPADEARRLGQAVRGDLDRTSDTLDDLMAWGRAEMDDRGPAPAAVAVRHAADVALDGNLRAADAKQIRLINAIDQDVVVRVDPAHLRSILRNLLGNSVKFTPHGGAVTLSAERVGVVWRLAVADTGAGMTPERIASVLNGDAFVSTRGTDGEPGSGLGLRIVRGFTEANRGTLAVRSEVGVGTTVEVDLPAG
jgi:signal transduction histidine kinase